MQTVYRINTIPGYKPWRGSGEILLSKNDFDVAVKIANDYGGDFHLAPAPGAEFDSDGERVDEDDTLSEWCYNQAIATEMPYILAGEETYYTE